jgi:hypothetical protein
MDRARYGDGGSRPTIVRIRGGLADTNEGMRATIGPLVIEHEPHETVDDFEERVIETAIEMCAPVIVFDGLPPTPDCAGHPTHSRRCI